MAFSLQSKSPPQDTLLSSSIASASSLVLLQLFARLLTFTLNQALVRLASPQTFGTAAIQFELLLSTILFLCRDGVRNALLRVKPYPTGRQQATATSVDSPSNDLTVNLSLLPVVLGIPIAVITALIYISSSSPLTTSQPHFHISVTIYAVAAFLELLSEPLYTKAQNQLRFEVRIRAEGSSVAAKAIVSFIILVATSPEWALVAFATGQAAYGLTMFISYSRVYGAINLYHLRKVPVSRHSNKTVYFDKEVLNLSAAMTAQSIVKHFLTEGDKFLVSRLSPLADQGGYALASNYGSLVARIIFQPIEETCRVFFSKTLSSSTNNTKKSLQVASNILLSLLLLFVHFFLLLISFGPPYLPLAVSILLPGRYHHTSAPLILRAYIYYIPTMAFNGLLEAFLASTSTPSDLRCQSRWMLFFSLGFVITAVTLARGLGWGDTGLVWANIANLGARALYAWLYVRRFFSRHGAVEMIDWRKSMPPLSIFSVFALTAGIARWSARAYHDLPLSSQLWHVSLGAGCIILCLITSYQLERTKFQEILVIIRNNK